MYARTTSLVTACAFLLGASAVCNASIQIDQYASSVIRFSSEFGGSTPPSDGSGFPGPGHGNSWGATQATGAPNNNGYGDHTPTWAPLAKNGTLEFITLGFSSLVYASGVTITESWGNGFVYQVDVVDTSDVLHTVFAGIDPSAPGTVVDFNVSWATTSFQVKGVKIYTDTNHNLDTWEEIDAVQLHGFEQAPDTAAVPEASMLVIWLGLVGTSASAAFRRDRLA